MAPRGGPAAPGQAPAVAPGGAAPAQSPRWLPAGGCPSPMPDAPAGLPEAGHPARGCAGLGGLALRGVLYQADDAVVVAAAAVDHAEQAALAVAERVEIVPHEFHLEERLIDGHRA